MLVTQETSIFDMTPGLEGWVADRSAIFTAHGGYIAGPGTVVTASREGVDDHYLSLTDDGWILVTMRSHSQKVFSPTDDDFILEAVAIVAEKEFNQLPGYRDLASSQAGLASLRAGANIGGARVTARSIRHMR